MPLEFEDSEVKDLSVSCPKGCAYCCLCPPGLLEGEEKFIVEGCPDPDGCIDEDTMGDSRNVIRSQGDWGACIFLHSLRCSSYKDRPHFCRQYPLQVYSGWRLQLSAIHSCRGLIRSRATGKKKNRGMPLKAILDKEIEVLGEGYFRDTLKETRTCFADLKKKRRIYDDIGTVQSAALKVASSVGDAKALGGFMGLEPEKGETRRKSLFEAVWPSIEDTFSSPEVMELPVFPAKDLSWRLFRSLSNDEISQYRLEETGSLVYMNTLNLKELELFPLTIDAKKVLGSYLSMAFGRDIFYGMIAREAVLNEVRMKELGTIIGAKIATDLWWRTGLISSFMSLEGGKDRDSKGKGSKKLGKKVARDATVFMDADLLDAFALGAII